jgi:MFS family permease
MTSVNLRAGKRLLLALPRLLGRYLETRKSLRGSISRQSRQGLDWMNFFLADVQTAFGAFVAFYLAGLGWPKDQVGLALTVGTLAGVISQIPGGALVDTLRWKRGLAAIGIGMLCASALILALVPNFALVFLAEFLHGLTAGIVTPAIAAISLGLVGRRAMSVRTGRNYQFNAAGNAITAGLMGLAGQYFATSAIFFGAAALCVPALIGAEFAPRKSTMPELVTRERASRPRVTIASSTSAKTAIFISLPPAFSYSNSPTLRCCRLLARTWRKARPNTHRYSWLA